MEEQVTWVVYGLHFNARSLVMSWVVMGIILILGIIAGRGATTKTPKGVTNLFEFVIEFVKKLIGESMPYRKGAPLLSLLTTLILFIFVSNLLGLLPNLFSFIPLNENLKEALVVTHGHYHPNMMSPTADLNITLGLALFMIILIQIWGIKWQKGYYFKHYLEPYKPFIIIHILENFFTKPVTLAFRLYGNIFAGEILIGVILGMGTSFYYGGFLAGLVWLAFSVFVGAIQAFVFTMLSISYTAQVVGDDDGHH